MDQRQQYKINISAPNLINICIDKNENGELEGRLYHCYTAEPIYFPNIVQLIIEIEWLCDAINFPQVSTKTRLFMDQTSVYDEKPEKVADQKEIIQYSGEKGTFITHIKFRQKSTWQGEFYWKEQDTVQRFSNTLDFIKQIDTILANK